MTATNHGLTGAIVAVAVGKPILAIPIAFMMHFAMDALPHFGVNQKDVYKRNSSKLFRTVLIGDMILAGTAIILVPLLLNGIVPAWLTAVCMFACMSPDLVWGWHFYYEVVHHQIRKKKFFSKFHSWIQWKEAPVGAPVEIFWFMACLLIISGLV